MSRDASGRLRAWRRCWRGRGWWYRRCRWRSLDATLIPVAPIDAGDSVHFCKCPQREGLELSRPSFGRTQRGGCDRSTSEIKVASPTRPSRPRDANDGKRSRPWDFGAPSSFRKFSEARQLRNKKRFGPERELTGESRPLMIWLDLAGPETASPGPNEQEAFHLGNVLSTDRFLNHPPQFGTRTRPFRRNCIFALS